MTRTSMLLIPGLMALLALGACGKVGVLDQPAPLYGEKAKADYQAQKRAADRAQTARDDNGQIETLPGDKTYDVNADPSPQRTLPIQGAGPDPHEPGNGGVLPDPLNTPK